ncbi:MAG TPA: CHAT domain-containing protein [Ilumatobacter sp.]|nr:CHAT domain-containing protein [Ilumatobacter sp.]
MLLAGGRGGTRAPDQPRVVQLQISRPRVALPRRHEPLEFVVAMHVEGTPITWQRQATLGRDDEQRMLEAVAGLRRWSGGVGLTRRQAGAAVMDLGRILRDAFLGTKGRRLLADIDRTALLLLVDETVLHLPWEMMFDTDNAPLVLAPFGRVVTTRVAPPIGRDPSTEDPTVRILAVENPTDDLAASERVMEIIHGLRPANPDLDIEVTTLARRDATRRRFAQTVRAQDFDIVHFAGHGRFDADRPSDSAVLLADGPLSDEQVLKLRWKQPPFVVWNSSCESARVAPGTRIVSNARRSNGLASAFLSRGVEAYLGHYFFVEDTAAAQFSEAFYTTLLRDRNVGRAVQEARRHAIDRFAADGDLTGLGAVFFGDAGTAQRRDLATAS